MAVADDRVFADGSLAAPPKPMLEGAPNLSAFRRQGRGRSAASGPTKKQQSDAPFDVDAVRAREITRAVMSHKHKERRKLQANPPAAVVRRSMMPSCFLVASRNVRVGSVSTAHTPVSVLPDAQGGGGRAVAAGGGP